MAGPDGRWPTRRTSLSWTRASRWSGRCSNSSAIKARSATSRWRSRARFRRRTAKIAILDTITLNMDRHGGNLMINDESGTPNLVPIDHGLTFPPAEARKELPERLGDKHNALLGIASAYEPFSAEMLNSIAKIEPGKMVSALKQERGVVDAVHEGTAAKLDEEALETSRRSAMFLKLAAPVLAPAVVQIALGRSEDVVQTRDQRHRFTKRAQTVITRYRRTAALMPNISS